MNDYLVRLAIRLRGLIEEQKGQDLVEYGLIFALVSIAAMWAVILTGPFIEDLWDAIQAQIAAAIA